MAYKNHFHFNLDYSENKFYRIKKANKGKFQVLKRKIELKSQRGKKIDESEINQLFSLMIDVEQEELRYYINAGEDHFETIQDHFTETENDLFAGMYSKDGMDVEDTEGVEGLWGMVFEVIFTTIRDDKMRVKPMKKDECIEGLISAMLIYRKDNMPPEVKEKYTLFMIAVIAAFTTHRVFNLMPANANYSNEEYYHMTKAAVFSAKTKQPGLFIGLTERE